MEENAIITFVFDANKMIDLEVPLTLNIEELSGMMIGALKTIDPEYFDNIKEVYLYSDGNYLSPDKTLMDYGIWTGSMLQVVVQ